MICCSSSRNFVNDLFLIHTFLFFYLNWSKPFCRSLSSTNAIFTTEISQGNIGGKRLLAKHPSLPFACVKLLQNIFFREQRSSNTLYQELSFQDTEALGEAEDGVDVAGTNSSHIYYPKTRKTLIFIDCLITKISERIVRKETKNRKI